MTNDRQLTIYRTLTALYPRSFRDDYREDLAVLFSHQINDGPPLGVWTRTIRDLAVTVPAHHLEAHMHRPSTPVLVGICSVTTATATALAVALGTGTPSLSIVFLMVALGAGAVGIWTWKAQQPVHDVASPDTLWWKFLIAGASMVAATFAGMAIPWPNAVDLGDNAYWLIVISMMTGIMLGAFGLLLGVAVLIRRHHHGQPTPGTT